jgi:hypothetical protein
VNRTTTSTSTSTSHQLRQWSEFLPWWSPKKLQARRINGRLQGSETQTNSLSSYATLHVNLRECGCRIWGCCQKIHLRL